MIKIERPRVLDADTKSIEARNDGQCVNAADKYYAHVLADMQAVKYIYKTTQKLALCVGVHVGVCVCVCVLVLGCVQPVYRIAFICLSVFAFVISSAPTIVSSLHSVHYCHCYHIQ